MQHSWSNALFQQANRFVSEGQLAAAIQALKQIISAQPSHYPAWLLLSKCLFDGGYTKEAVDVAGNAEAFDPFQPEFGQIQGHMQNRRFSQARDIATGMLAKQPGHPRAVFTLAHLAIANACHQQAVTLLEQGLEHSPANATLINLLVEACETCGEFAKAINAADILVSLVPSFDTYWLKANLLLRLGQYNRALDACSQAVEKLTLSDIQRSQVSMTMGQVYRILGRKSDCIEAFKSGLVHNPNNAEIWCALADLKDYSFSEADVNALGHLAASKPLSAIDRCAAAFALAKASESQQDPATYTQHYHRANRLHPGRDFSSDAVATEFSQRACAFSDENTAAVANPSNQELTPIFILGLPRSGSTLVEQILASHSAIEATIEQPTLACVERNANALCLQKFKQPLFSALSSLTATDLGELGQSYLDKGQLFRTTNRAFFTDKQPFNFRHIGLIHKILPRAVIIDVRRNPLDCGVSLFKQFFKSGVEFSYDLSTIGQFYRHYIALMEHWDNSLPGKVLKVQYELLVQSPELEIRRILNQVGVDFEEQCLNFHQGNRKVHTASSEQVRRPLNRDGIGIWQAFGESLSPLREALGDDILEANKDFIDID